jgi:hypothetical protein
MCWNNSTNEVTYGSTCNSSDGRLKTNIRPLENSLDKVLALKPIRFDWKDAKRAKVDGPQIGLIAQDVEPLLPQLVTTNTDDLDITFADGSKETVKNPKSFDYAKLSVPLISALQELYRKWSGDHAALAALKADDDKRLTALKADNDNFRAGEEKQLATLKADNDNLRSLVATQGQEIDVLKAQMTAAHHQ